MSVCLSVSNKRQIGKTDQDQILCGTSRDPMEGSWMIKISKIGLSLSFENQRNFVKKFAKRPVSLVYIYFDCQFVCDR